MDPKKTVTLNMTMTMTMAVTVTVIVSAALVLVLTLLGMARVAHASSVSTSSYPPVPPSTPVVLPMALDPANSGAWVIQGGPAPGITAGSTVVVFRNGLRQQDAATVLAGSGNPGDYSRDPSNALRVLTTVSWAADDTVLAEVWR